MSSFFTLFLFCLHFALANAALFIREPFAGTICQGGQPCNVTWVDDGVAPLLSAIGVSTVGLYTGKQQLVQTLPAVDVATTSHFTFTPTPAAGPDSEDYYIAFISTQVNGKDGSPYIGYSPNFQLTGMSGSFNSPLPAATSSIPVPQSIQTPSILSRTSTATVGTLSTSHTLSSSLPPTSTSFTSSSGFSTSRPAVSKLSTSSSSSASATASSKSNGSPSHLPALLPVLLLALFSSAFFS